MVWESEESGEGNVYGGKNLPKTQVLSSEWKTEWVREDESGNSKVYYLQCALLQV